jgi:predicted nucleic acid-binding protein
MLPLVVDTSILVGALLKRGGTARRVIRGCLKGDYEPLIGPALYSEYEDVFGREEIWRAGLLTARERNQVFDGFLAVCRWVEVFYAWRPNLPDEADNHLVELALAGNAAVIVTRNISDLKRGELRFPSLAILTPKECLEAYPCPP